MRRAPAVATMMLSGVLLAGVPSPLTGAYAEEQVTETELTVTGTPEPDGRPVLLDATIMTTDPGASRPAIVLAHGFGGTKDDSAETARTMARDGYTVITYTARGFGRSGGLIHLNHPDYEGADARRIIDLAAGRAEVSKVREDPVIGFAGVSYGGALALLVAGLDRRVDAIVPVYQVALAGERALVLPEVALEVLGGNALDVPLALILAVALLCLSAIGALLWLRRRHR